MTEADYRPGTDASSQLNQNQGAEMHGQRQRMKVLCGGIASLLLSLGVARFSYTPLLPLMQEQAGLGVAAAGFLAAVNYAGYLSGAILAAVISDPAMKDRLYRIGMVVAVASTIMMGLTSNVNLWGASRFLAGLSSAAGMLLGTGLILNWLIREGHRGELGIHFAGIGLSIAGCAALVQIFTPEFDWREQWLAFSAIGLILLIPALGWVPKAYRNVTSQTGDKMKDQPPSALYLWIFMAAYFCAGVGYVISATFIVAIVEKLPGLSGKGNLAFLAIGAGAAPASIVWDFVARRMGHLNALILVSVLHIIGIVLPVATNGFFMTMLGAFLFGATFVGLVSLVLTMAGKFYPTRPAKMMGKMTLAYGAAQMLGPAVAGVLASRFGGYEAAIYMATVVMLVGTNWSGPRFTGQSAVGFRH